jgi:hypothetical protein
MLPETVALQATLAQYGAADEAGKSRLRAVRITESAARIAFPSDPVLLLRIVDGLLLRPGPQANR